MIYKEKRLADLIRTMVIIGNSEDAKTMLLSTNQEEMTFIAGFGRLAKNHQELLILKYAFERDDEHLAQRLELEDVGQALEEAHQALDETTTAAAADMSQSLGGLTAHQKRKEAMAQIRNLERHNYDHKKTAVIVRRLLEKAYPGVKFFTYMRKNRGEVEMKVTWQDGPTERAVDAIVRPLERYRFDGRINTKAPVFHWEMPDGQYTPAYSPGTESKGGSIRHFITQVPEEARLVHLGIDMIFTERVYSRRFMEEIAERVQTESGWNRPPIEVAKWQLGGKEIGEKALFSVDPQALVPGSEETIGNYYWAQAYHTAGEGAVAATPEN